jgi:cardiolipin synthase
MHALRKLLASLTFANQLTFIRLVAIPFFVISLLQGRNGLALALFVGAGLTDLLDGLVARWLDQKSALGAFLDPAADKFLMLAAFVTLALNEELRSFPDYRLANHIPLWLTILVVARDVFIVVTALILYLTYGTSRFPPTRLGKWTTGVESGTVGLVLIYNAVGVRSDLWVPLAVWITLAFVCSSGFHYIYRAQALVNQSAREADG